LRKSVTKSTGSPAGDPVDFVTDFRKDGKTRGRPVGVTVDGKTGALIVADDLSNTIWRVTRAQ
jgi:glucose/arabinose dehydrogenase